MPFVLDASATLSWFFDDEVDYRSPEVLARLLRENAIVPAIWWFEVRNALLMSERAGRATADRTAQTLLRLESLPVYVDREPDERAIYEVSRRHGLTFYDASYLELAQRSEVGLATLDRALMKAARAEGVPLIG